MTPACPRGPIAAGAVEVGRGCGPTGAWRPTGPVGKVYVGLPSLRRTEHCLPCQLRVAWRRRLRQNENSENRRGRNPRTGEIPAHGRAAEQRPSGGNLWSDLFSRGIFPDFASSDRIKPAGQIQHEFSFRFFTQQDNDAAGLSGFAIGRDDAVLEYLVFSICRRTLGEQPIIMLEGHFHQGFH